MSHGRPGGYQPRRPALVATLVCIAAGMTLLWPMLTGQFLAGPQSDQYVAGYGFRYFAAQAFRDSGSIPLWNPYIFGGLPFVGAMHGDVFYPTAWMRWILPTDLAMNLGFAVHLVLAGCTMYALLRAFDVTWGGALIGGLSYELTGIVASLVSPGHDGKLFVSALTPLLFLAILRAARDRSLSAFPLIALVVGLTLHGHPQLSYYLLVAAAMWGAYLVFLGPERPQGKTKILVTVGALGAVALGFALYAIQAMPFIEYIPFSPRAGGGPSGGWEYMTAFSLPPDELVSAVLPEFNGILDAYWGRNYPIKHHTEYVGVIPLVLALVGMRAAARRSTVRAFGVIGTIFLLIALGRFTPFYRLWYEVMPLMQKVRAPGMAFFLVAFPLCVLAGFGAERVLRREVAPRSLWLLGGTAAVIGLLGLAGVLQVFAEGLVMVPELMPQVAANADTLRVGGLRILVLGVAAAALLGTVAAGSLRGRRALLLVAALTVADLWSVERKFFTFQPRAEVLFADDEITRAIRATPKPYRIWDPGRVYRGSILMGYGIPNLLGYHGNELRYFDELLGGKGEWGDQAHPAVLRLFAVRYLVFPRAIALDSNPGLRHVAGPVTTTTGIPSAYLYEFTDPPPYATVVPAAAKVPEGQIISTVLDLRFPPEQVVLYPDTAAVTPQDLADGALPPPSAATATVTEWRPGRMRVSLQGELPEPAYLIVAENWYKAWTATVDGQPAHALRADYSLLSVALPPGAREVVFEFSSSAYRTGRAITLSALVLVLGLFGAARVRERRGVNG